MYIRDAAFVARVFCPCLAHEYRPGSEALSGGVSLASEPRAPHVGRWCRRNRAHGETTLMMLRCMRAYVNGICVYVCV